MSLPKINFIPLRNAISSESPTTLDLLVEIVPPATDAIAKRPPLNLGLAIDRSSSMQGAKIALARQVAHSIVEQLQPGDRISITTFDRQIETCVPSTFAENKTLIGEQIDAIDIGEGTAFYEGWLEAGIQVSWNLNSQQLNRVIIISDGLVNCGETSTRYLANNVEALAAFSISTTVVGIGYDRDENLLKLLADRGDGHYYSLNGEEEIPEILTAKTKGVLGIFGRDVSLKIQPLGEVKILDVFSDFETGKDNEYLLTSLINGSSITLGLRLKFPPGKILSNPCNFQLSWRNPITETQHIFNQSLHFPAVSDRELADFALNARVQQQVALMLAGRAKKEARRQADLGNWNPAMKLLEKAIERLQRSPHSFALEREAHSLLDLHIEIQSKRAKLTRQIFPFQYSIAPGNCDREIWELGEPKNSWQNLVLEKNLKNILEGENLDCGDAIAHLKECQFF